MDILHTTTAMAAWSKKAQIQGRTIALVPTMGFFHDGHIALMKRAVQEADLVVVSLFVNPTQFGENEDLANYPRDFERDEHLARAAGVHALFCPTVSDMYGPQSQTTVSVATLTTTLCGASRPGHFNGVTTVVTKLFNIVQPHYAIFGQKDLQQLVVIRRMVDDLNFPIEIIAQAIVREEDGLAMSSRNSYLTVAQRQQALCLSKSLREARKYSLEGLGITEVKQAVELIIAAQTAVEIDYIAIIDDRTLNECETIDEHAVLAMAVKVGATRLIDNGWLLAGEEKMLRGMLKSKIHKATVTQSDLMYEGSLTIDRDLMAAVDLLPYEKIKIYNINNGERFDTYAIEGEPGSGVIGLNGAAARKGMIGDLIIIVSYALFTADDLNGFEPKVVILDKDNRLDKTIECGFSESILTEHLQNR